MSFIAELKRRNVFRVGIVYVVTAWLVAQVADLVLDNIESPAWVMQVLMLVLALGLPFALIFAWAYELTPEGLKKEKDVDRTQSITPQTGRKLDFIIIGALVLALGYFAWDKFVLTEAEDHSQTAAAQSGQAAAESSAPAPGKSIAVLPFVNMSSDPEQEYFSDGISEEILNSLSKVKELEVAGRTSSFAFKGQNQDLRRIAEALGVQNILEGSVRKSGNTVRITAQLIRADNGFHLWSETYDRQLDNVFAIQDEIARNILQQLKATLLEGEESAVSAARTNTEAYDLYLLAKQRLYERTGPTIQAAADLLDRAIALDSQYAPAYAQRGIAALLLAEGAGTYGDIPLQQALTQGRLYLDKALQLDPDLAEAWAGLGLYYEGQPKPELKPAIEALRKALAMNPGLIDASNWLHNALQSSGKPGEAQTVVLGMIERDPLYRPGIRNAVNSFVLYGEQDKAEAFLQRIEPLIPNDAVIQSSEAAIKQSLGELAEGTRLAESAVALQPSNSVARLTRSFGWLYSHQYERVATEGEEWHPIIALTYLGRQEEAAILAFKRAEEQADVPTLFNFLNIAGRSDELVAYLEARWPDLDALRKDFPPYSALGDFLMIDVALAYSRAGNQQRFDQAMAYVRAAHEALIAGGVDNSVFFITHAAYLALAGERESSLDYLDRAIGKGFITTIRITQEWPYLATLEGDPRFEAIQARMVEHLNSERAKMDLGPATI
jgi:TolB-like protein/Tfp pilus assembly protein PilF